jgi:hypothetical protein
MKISDIIGGTKKRKHRDPRKHRIVQQDLYTVHPSDLKEAKGREINHAEDLILWDGTAGATKAIMTLRKLESSPQSATIKWDGSPAVIFGRNEAGKFVLTDKSGFGAKGYDGKVTSAEDLEKMFLSRGKEAPDDKRQQFAAAMRSVWPIFEAATPANFRGYVHGDLLYYTTPAIKDNKYVFTPNTTTYQVDKDSPIGKRIGQSTTGVVLHAMIDLDGNKGTVNAKDFTSGDLLVMPPAVVTQAPAVDVPELQKLEQFVAAHGKAVDAMLNIPDELKLKNFSDLLYAYINSSVKRGTLDTLGSDFFDWLPSSKISGGQQQRVADWIKQNIDGFNSLFTIVRNIISIKNKIIAELDAQPAEIEAYTDGQRGGEGYVVDKDVKLVNRAGFTAANFARDR